MPKPPERDLDPTFERVRRDLTYLPVPEGWIPDPLGEKLWLDDLDSMTEDEIHQLDRFTWTGEDDVTVRPVEPGDPNARKH